MAIWVLASLSRCKQYLNRWRFSYESVVARDVALASHLGSPAVLAVWPALRVRKGGRVVGPGDCESRCLLWSDGDDDEALPALSEDLKGLNDMLFSYTRTAEETMGCKKLEYWRGPLIVVSIEGKVTEAPGEDESENDEEREW